MDAFLGWFYEYMSLAVQGIYAIISGIAAGLAQLFGLATQIRVFSEHSPKFSTVDWVLAVLTVVLSVALWVIVAYLIFLLIRRRVRLSRELRRQETVFEEIADLHKEILRLNEEKDSILAMKISQAGVSAKDLARELDSISERSRANAAAAAAVFDPNAQPVAPFDGELPTSGGEQTPPRAVPAAAQPVGDVRFARLLDVDRKYVYYTPPQYAHDFTLADLCESYRNFACSQMGLFYNIDKIRFVFAGLAASKMLLLQGISGTGKTSLPYSMGKFFLNDATIASVQPSWRDRTELFGYFNEFTKRYNETEVLKRIYEAGYNDDMNIVILDEMNIARVEYYFAEVLSILEMPDPNEWKLEIVPSSWPTDPAKLTDGKLVIPENVWYIGTANNDDSTFSVSDKVYDRAITINLDAKGEPFEAPATAPVQVSYSYFRELCTRAISEHPLSKESREKISRLDIFIIQKLRVAFGNRIIKQMNEFVPVYVACGGSELDGIDYILATKVFRKFESLNLSLIRDELRELSTYLTKSFGKNNMHECQAYIEYLEKLF